MSCNKCNRPSNPCFACDHGCLRDTLGQCVFYTGPETDYLQIPTGLSLDKIVLGLDSTIEDLQDQVNKLDLDFEVSVHDSPTVQLIGNGRQSPLTANVKLSAEAGNSLTIKADGLYITPSGASQINSDWNATSGVSQILNKPTLSTVATSGNYNDLSNKPTIENIYTADGVIFNGASRYVDLSSGASLTFSDQNGGRIAYDENGTTIETRNNSNTIIRSVTTTSGNSSVRVQDPVANSDNNIVAMQDRVQLYSTAAGVGITQSLFPDRIEISNGPTVINTLFNTGVISGSPATNQNEFVTFSQIPWRIIGNDIYNSKTGNVGIGLGAPPGNGNNAPTSTLDIFGIHGYSQLRLRVSYTPTSSSDTNGSTGDVSWDDNYIYIKTNPGGTPTWKRAALTTF